MKKLYTKPEIMFENFTLSTNIAGDCNVKTNTPSAMQCAVSYDDEFAGKVNVFISDIQACEWHEGVNIATGICYNTPSDGMNLFNS